MRASSCLLLLFVASSAAAADEPPVLRVGVAGSAPFVIHRDGRVGDAALSGLSVDVWRALAERAGVRFEMHRQGTVSEALDAVAQGGLDVAVGPISITSERLEHVDFTHPYYESSLAILAPRVATGPLAWIRPFFSKAFVFGLLGLLTVLFFVGVLLWLAERKQNASHFPHTPVRGIGNGIWAALVTMTTVGYGDRVPVTPAGRVITGAWMLVAMITASSLTAGIASALTLQHLEHTAIESADQLRARRVATVRGSTAEAFADQNGARVVSATELGGAVARLAQGDADAVVFDEPMIQYYLREHPTAPFDRAERTYEPQGYGFAVPVGSGLGHRLDVALERLRESGRLRAIERRWLGE